MPKASAKSFRATLEATDGRLRWVIARIPFDIKEAWPERNGRRVRGEINGFAFRSSLFPNSRDGGYMLLVNKTMQAGARANAGDEVKIRLEPDMEERTATIPGELARALRGEPALKKWFANLKPSLRRDLGRWVSEPKSEASRTKRAEQCAEWMLLTMEGEQDTPPILRAAFQRHPGAGVGWDAMTVIRRRNHLLSVFHYQTPEARDRRVQAVVADALNVAKKTEKNA
jgi:uncharacterized protein YdeI (YjbR/CyaY-like superfamily)